VLCTRWGLYRPITSSSRAWPRSGRFAQQPFDLGRLVAFIDAHRKPIAINSTRTQDQPAIYRTRSSLALLRKAVRPDQTPANTPRCKRVIQIRHPRLITIDGQQILGQVVVTDRRNPTIWSQAREPDTRRWHRRSSRPNRRHRHKPLPVHETSLCARVNQVQGPLPPHTRY